MRVDVAVAGIMDVRNMVLDIAQIRRDACNGRLSVEQLVDIIEKQPRDHCNAFADNSRDSAVPFE